MSAVVCLKLAGGNVASVVEELENELAIRATLAPLRTPPFRGSSSICDSRRTWMRAFAV
jgi:hypothetical protein